MRSGYIVSSIVQKRMRSIQTLILAAIAYCWCTPLIFYHHKIVLNPSFPMVPVLKWSEKVEVLIEKRKNLIGDGMDLNIIMCLIMVEATWGAKKWWLSENKLKENWSNGSGNVGVLKKEVSVWGGRLNKEFKGTWGVEKKGCVWKWKGSEKLNFFMNAGGNLGGAKKSWWVYWKIFF